MSKITIDDVLCKKCGLCTLLCPESICVQDNGSSPKLARTQKHVSPVVTVLLLVPLEQYLIKTFRKVAPFLQKSMQTLPFKMPLWSATPLDWEVFTQELSSEWSILINVFQNFSLSRTIIKPMPLWPWVIPRSNIDIG